MTVAGLRVRWRHVLTFTIGTAEVAAGVWLDSYAGTLLAAVGGFMLAAAAFGVLTDALATESRELVTLVEQWQRLAHRLDAELGRSAAGEWREVKGRPDVFHRRPQG